MISCHKPWISPLTKKFMNIMYEWKIVVLTPSFRVRGRNFGYKIISLSKLTTFAQGKSSIIPRETVVCAWVLDLHICENIWSKKFHCILRERESNIFDRNLNFFLAIHTKDIHIASKSTDVEWGREQADETKFTSAD